MKKYILTIITIFLFSNFVFSQQILEQVAKKTASNIADAIKLLPKDSKVSLTFFVREDLYDDKTTYLGIKFTNYLAQEVRKEIQKRKYSHKLLFPEEVDAMLYEKMKAGFKKPDNISSKDFWAEFLNNNTADFFISGKYKIKSDYSVLSIEQTKIIPNQFGGYPKESIKAVKGKNSKKIKNNTDKEYLKKIDVELREINDFYTQLFAWQGKWTDFNIELLDAGGNKLEKNNLIIGKEYNIAIELQEDAYVYAFFFDPSDTENPLIYMLFPYAENQNTFLSKGEHSIPPGYTFTPEPPGDEEQVFFQIFVSKTKIPIKFTNKEDDEGYIQAVFSETDCELFLKQLNKMDKSKIYTKQVVYTRTIFK